jgi:uncharacterized protein (DUF2249 family)
MRGRWTNRLPTTSSCGSGGALDRIFTPSASEGRVPSRAIIIQIKQENQPMTPQTLELDVRAIPPREKHPSIFRTFDGLSSGQAMVIINDHDPRPLRYQFMAERADSFDWQYEAEGPEIWRVRISRR